MKLHVMMKSVGFDARGFNSNASKFRSTPSWRYFSSSAPRTRTPGKTGSSKGTGTSTSSPTKLSLSEQATLKYAGRQPEGFGKLERKVAKHGDVLLYRAPSQRAYMLGAYGAAAFCFAYSTYNSNVAFRKPIVPLQNWQKMTYGVACVMMSVIGTAFIFKTFNMVKSITAVRSNGRTRIRIGVNRWIPFIKRREFDVVPRQIAFSRRLVVSSDASNGMRRGGQTPRKDPLSLSTFFTAPVRGLSRMLWNIFYSIKRVFTLEDFILLEIEGQKGTFKMDTNGFLSEDFLYVSQPIAAES